MILPATSISPALGRSSPAIERSVVVLPQPEGPSSVNNLPSGTSKLTSCAARTGVPRSPGYSVDSDLTFNTFGPRFRYQMSNVRCQRSDIKYHVGIHPTSNI